MKKAIVSVAILLMAATGLSHAATGRSAKISNIGITAGVPKTAVSTYGNYKPFFTATFYFFYNGKKTVMFSGDEQGKLASAVGDLLQMTVVHPDGTEAQFNYDYGHDCSTPAGTSPLDPQDVSYAFAPGMNKVTVVLSEMCAQGAYSTPLWLGAF